MLDESTVSSNVNDNDDNEEEDDDEDDDDSYEDDDDDDDGEDKHGWERMDHNGKLYFWNWDSSETTWKR